MASLGMGDQNLIISSSFVLPHWARVVGYGPFSLWVIHKEGLCPSSGDINRLMMMMMMVMTKNHIVKTTIGGESVATTMQLCSRCYKNKYSRRSH
jgi:hypothetical protein